MGILLYNTTMKTVKLPTNANSVKMLEQHSKYSYEELSQVFIYEPISGSVYRKDGKSCRSVSDQGYIGIRYKTTTFRAHRLGWLLYYGEWPLGYIDHKDGVPSNNSILNLRTVTAQQNIFNNRRKSISNQNGFVGVTKNIGKHGRVRYNASIWLGGKRITCGNYDTAEEASAAYQLAKVKYHTYEETEFGTKRCFTQDDARAATFTYWHTNI